MPKVVRPALRSKPVELATVRQRVSVNIKNKMNYSEKGKGTPNSIDGAKEVEFVDYH